MDARPRLLQQLRDRLRTKHYSYRTEQQYLGRIRRFVLHHGKRHPREMSAREVEEFLTWLATHRQVSASTQNQALSAILFLYRQVLEFDLPWLENVVRAKRPARVPVVLSAHDVKALLTRMTGSYRIIAQLMYGSGLRLMKSLRLRVKDLDFAYSQIIVRDGKGRKDRVTVLPDAAVQPLKTHLLLVREQHEAALRQGHAVVDPPFALKRKHPNAGVQWAWQYVFPAARPSRDRRSGAVRRHHLHETSVQRAKHRPGVDSR